MTHAFSLLELLIVITIVGILTAISVPLYTQHIAAVHCKQARVALLDMAHKLEQEHLLTTQPAAIRIQALIPDFARQIPYHFSAQFIDKHNYVLTATAHHPDRLEASCHSLMVRSLE